MREHFRAAGDLFAASGDAELDLPRYNIRPTERIWTIARDPESGARVLAPMRWGFLPHWYKSESDGPLLINARGETVAEKPAFRKACRERRCLIPADGFYEWRASAGRGKEPYWIGPAADEGPIAFAGVWRVWSGPDGQEIASTAIVTCAAAPPLAEIHERQPVVISPDGFGLWLGEEGRGAAALMTAAEAEFFALHRVSRAINKGGRAAPDGPELREPIIEPDEDPLSPPAPEDDAPRLL